MLQSFFLISKAGEVLIEKHWREVTPRSVCDYFWDEVNKHESREEMPPVVHTTKYYLVSIYREGMFFVGTTTVETNPLGIIEFLHRMFDTFESYFEDVTETNIKDNFSTVYQLLEEMMDFGYALTTEPNALKLMIKPPSVLARVAQALGRGSSQVSDELAEGTISNMPWRMTNVVHSQNKIYLDIVEEVDSILSVNGIIVSSEVNGVILGNSEMSGVPDLSLHFGDPTVIDDCSFHPCVRYGRFERDSVVSFVPPDGAFELMRYRIAQSSQRGHTIAPCYCQPVVHYNYEEKKGDIDLVCGIRSTSSLIFPSSTGGTGGGMVDLVESVVVEIPFSRTVRTTNLEVDTGTVLYDEATKIAKWTIGKLTSDKLPRLKGTMLLQQIAQNTKKHASKDPNNADKNEVIDSPPIQMHWKVPMASLSGLSVASLQLHTEDYKPYKGVRTIAKSGKFQIRTI
jgi:AP-3 complex subunit mu